ncbi:MAG: FkbM family methyltransferase [Thalassobaculaceae bacterium]|nr:FkbM family methyltransferase [Thalassobaculaceae bacterium]
MPSPTHLRESGPEMRDSIAAVLQAPSDALELLRLSVRLQKARRPQISHDALGPALAWFSAAASCAGAVGRTLVENNADVTARLLNAAAASPRRSIALDRICRLFPARPEFWLLKAAARAETDDPAAERRCLRRVMVLDPNRPGASIRLSVSLYRDSNVDRASATGPARRAAVLRPDLAGAHRALAGVLLDDVIYDAAVSPLLRNSLRRWVLLEGDLGTARPALEGAFRRTGDLEALKTVGHWARLHSAAAGKGRASRKSRVALETFAAEIEGLAPFTLDTDFKPRIFGTRVLLHPKLPDDGVWRLRGPADQVERAEGVLRHYNPRATILSTDAPADGARILSLVPCDEAGAWYLPCLWGHPHIWWTVLPAILDVDGRPSLERARTFGLRTGQNITFWSGDGSERAYIAEHEGLGREIAARMGDAASREGYLETMAADRPTFLRRFFTEAGHRAQYFDYAVYRPGDVILSMGVAEGFEIPAYLALVSPGGALHNIDPDGHDRLGEPARAWIEATDCAVHVHRFAMSDVDGEIRMQTGGHWEDTRLSKRPEHQMTVLPSKRLDTLIAEQKLDRIDHIKLDIEGGEGFLLDQVIEVMRTHRPQIEISIYHTIQQFFDIPHRMMTESTGYRFYFHHYSGQFAEATLYAIPEEIEPLMPIKP